jgi:hypothetical protein
MHLFRQIRVLLLLKSRFPDVLLSVENVSTGVVSLHKLIAVDTLTYTNGMKNKMSSASIVDDLRRDVQESMRIIEYEKNCLFAFQSHAKPTSLSPTNKAVEQSKSSLQAFGQIADTRWREIVALAALNREISKQFQEESKSRTGDRLSSNKQMANLLLLYFPRHFRPDYFGSYRGIVLMERLVFSFSFAC